MNREIAQWLVLFCVFMNFVSYNLSFYHDNVPCSPVGYCKCEFPNGLGIDLNLLAGINWSIPIGPDEQLYYFPCKNIPVQSVVNVTTLNECIGETSGTSLCLRHDVNKTVEFHNLGFLEESSFLWERINDQPILTYIHNAKTSRIVLECGKVNEAPTLVHTGSTNNIYNLKIISELACVTATEEEGRSVLSTLVIIVLFLFLVYLLSGILVLKFIRGATGWEAIPNGEFWRNIFGSLKQVFGYFVNGCRQPETYDTI